MRKILERFEARFPQLFVSIYLGAFEELQSLRQFGFWMLNRAAYVDVDLERPNENGILIVVDVNAKNAVSGRTPLHNAARKGHKEIAELLIAKGANLDAKDKDGTTPLHITTLFGHKEIAELLIAKGADLDAQSKRGQTPLDMAITNPAIADLLRKHGGKRGRR